MFFWSFFLLYAVSFYGKKSHKKDAASIRAGALVGNKVF
jgi:hypothetical protein